MKNLVLDTNAYRRLTEKHVQLVEIVENADKIFLSVIVAGELLFGYEHGSKKKENINQLTTFINSYGVNIAEMGWETAAIYAKIKNQIYKLGKPIPSNDVWIAAQTIETGSVLVTYDDHFKYIPGLRIWNE